MIFLCKRFGSVEKLAKISSSLRGITGLRVKICNYDVRLIPQFIPLVDVGIAIVLIRIVVEERSCSDLIRSEEDEGITASVSMNYAHVARDGRMSPPSIVRRSSTSPLSKSFGNH